MNLFHRSMILGAALAAPLSVAQAATIIHTSVIDRNTTDFTVSDTLSGFDSSLGTLTGVQVEYFFALDSEGTLTNLSPQAQNFRFSTDYEAWINFDGPAAIAGDYDITFSSGQVQYSLDAGESQPFGPYSFSEMGTLNPSDITGFIDNEFGFTLDTFTITSMRGGGGNIRQALETYGEGFVRVIYTYDAGIVPEPATWAMLIAGFGMVGFAARRRKNVVTA